MRQLIGALTIDRMMRGGVDIRGRSAADEWERWNRAHGKK